MRRETARTRLYTPALSFDQAFEQARKAAHGAGGSFEWTNPHTGKVGTYQTNIKGEGYVRNPTPV